MALNGHITPSLSSSILFATLTDIISQERVPSARNCGYSTCPLQNHLRCLGPGGVSREALDARHDPPEQGSCQVAFDPNPAIRAR
jgi:hypothetical protein